MDVVTVANSFDGAEGVGIPIKGNYGTTKVFFVNLKDKNFMSKKGERSKVPSGNVEEINSIEENLTGPDFKAVLNFDIQIAIMDFVPSIVRDIRSNYVVIKENNENNLGSLELKV